MPKSNLRVISRQSENALPEMSPHVVYVRRVSKVKANTESLEDLQHRNDPGSSGIETPILSKRLKQSLEFWSGLRNVFHHRAGNH